MSTSRSRLSRMAAGVTATALAGLALAGPAMADSGSSSNTFVIGDQNNLALGSQVSFWGAQWWKANPLSTGSAPASFKGYADNLSGTCGGTWSTGPGNSPHPPASLPGDIDVIVSSTITKSGPVISGDIQSIAIVAPNPGYAGDPGHPGTGTIVGYVCGAPANAGGSSTGGSSSTSGGSSSTPGGSSTTPGGSSSGSTGDPNSSSGSTSSSSGSTSSSSGSTSSSSGSTSSSSGSTSSGSGSAGLTLVV